MTKKIILITGASAGIGKDAARTLIEKGHTVYAVARRVAQMNDLKEIGGIPLKMDITKEQDISSVLEQIYKEQGKLDVLINNAGYATQGPIEQVSIEDAKKMYEVNFFGLAKLTQKVLPNMREARVGRIINISSIAGKMHMPLAGWYLSTKHALEGWSDALRIEVKPFAIDVVVIEPGLIATEFGDVAMPSMQNFSDGPYANLVQAFAKIAQGSSASPPSVITNLIVQAIDAKNPKTRYVGGAMAKPMLFFRKWLGDKKFDKMISKMLS